MAQYSGKNPNYGIICLALDSFRLLASVYELESRTYNRRINELIELFELAEFIKTPVRKLSLGQRMRCELAACILHQPKVIFLDEPTIGLDVVVKVKIRELIKRVNQEEGTTIFLTSHDAGDIEQLCKRVIVINHGDIILDAATSHLRHNYLSWKIVKVKFAEPNPNLKLRERKQSNILIKELSFGSIPMKLKSNKY